MTDSLPAARSVPDALAPLVKGTSRVLATKGDVQMARALNIAVDAIRELQFAVSELQAEVRSLRDA